MQTGVPREIKSQEYRVGLTPAGARELAGRGHEVLIDTQAGAAVGLPDEAYTAARAIICSDARVANMPGAVARTSTFALTNATLGHAITLADKGWKRAMTADAHLRAGLNICEGHVTHEAVARALGEPYVPAHDLLG